MKKIFFAIAALAALVSCRSLKEEWQPVFTFGDNEPAAMKIWAEGDLAKYGFNGSFATIKELKQQYNKKTDAEKKITSGHVITDNIWIRGQVVSDDRTGNLYREIYLQDATGGIDLKLGKSALYSDYKLGQWVYVLCRDLCIGEYNGMPQLGLEPDSTASNEYETSYIDIQAVIDSHVFRGEYDTPVSPKVVTEAQLKAALTEGFTGDIWGTYVTLSGLSYADETFALLYPHGILNHKKDNPYNRLFLSSPQSANNRVAGFDYTWGITTWAMSKSKYIDYIKAGKFDKGVVGSGSTKYGPITTRPIDYKTSASAAAANGVQPGASVKTDFDKQGYTPSLIPESVLEAFGDADANMTFKDLMIKYATANYVSHYFNYGGTQVQVRTSGYAKFADDEIDSAILGGSNIAITGILTIYDGSAQLSLITSPTDDKNPSVKKL